MPETPKPALLKAEEPKPRHVLTARNVEGVSVPCPKCRGEFSKTITCRLCDCRGAVVVCASCNGTGLIRAERAVYGVVQCPPCSQTGMRPAGFAGLTGTIVPNKFCRKCGVTGQHVLTPMGSVCAACDQRVDG